MITALRSATLQRYAILHALSPQRNHSGVSYSRRQLPFLFLIEKFANFFRQRTKAEGLLQERHFGVQNTEADHDIVCMAALK